MIITVLAVGKFPNTFQVSTPEGEKFVKPSGKCKTKLEVGATYEVNLFQPPDKKTVYVTQAVLTTDKQPGTTPVEAEVSQAQPPVKSTTVPPTTTPPSLDTTPSVIPTSKPKTVTQTDDKMTKEDWAKKDLGIKWLTCLKVSAIFNAHRADIDVNRVVDDARLLYNSATDSKVQAQRDGLETKDHYKDL